MNNAKSLPLSLIYGVGVRNVTKRSVYKWCLKEDVVGERKEERDQTKMGGKIMYLF